MNAGAGVLQVNQRCFTQAGVERTDFAATISAVGNGSTRSTLPNVGPLTVVWCELISITGTFRGVATFNLRDPNQVLLTTAGVLGVQPGNSFSVPIDITPTGGTGVAVANLKDTSVSVTLRLLNENGALIATATNPRFTSFPARGQFSDFVTNIFPQLSGIVFRGALVIDAPQVRHRDLWPHSIDREGRCALSPACYSGHTCDRGLLNTAEVGGDDVRRLRAPDTMSPLRFGRVTPTPGSATRCRSLFSFAVTFHSLLEEW